jgi:long-chain acyl-CoA synthetase
MKTLNDLLDHAAQSAPPRSGLMTADKFISYAELKSRVLLAASGFKTRGIKQGDRVAIVHRNAPVFIEAYFSLSRLGAIAVPINYMIHNPEELAYMLGDCGAAGIVTQKEFLKGLRDAVKTLPKEPRLWISDALSSECHENEEPFSELSAGKAESFDSSIAEDEVAAILYTSGTTGKPKGVMLTHKNLITNTEGGIARLNLFSHDSSLAILPMFHTLAWTANVLVSMRLGSRLAIAPSITPPKPWLNLMAKSKTTLFLAVPQIYSLLGKSSRGLKGFILRHWYFRKVRMAVSGAAPLPVATIENFERSFKVKILEGYGLTETSPVITINSPDHPKPGSVGKPIDGVEVKIIDDEERTLKAGEEGEICARGHCVMKGYYNLPEETKRTFTKDGWLKTGDIGILDEEGYLFIRDRKKDMIIIKGLKVFSAQVEAVLAENPEILESAVIGVPDEHGDEIIKAFIVLKPGSKEDKSSLMKYCREKFDSYKRPRDIEIVESLPKNSLQKILKRTLREMEIKKRATSVG